MKTTRILRHGSFIFNLLAGLLVISPLLLGFSMSFMGRAELAAIPPHAIPRTPVMYTYSSVLRMVPLFSFLLNTIIVCAAIIAGQFITCSSGAFAFAFFRFAGQRLLFMMVLATMMIPADAIIIANYITISRMRLNNTHMGLIVPYLTSAMGIFLIRQFFLTIPKELREAAILDGCKDTRFLFSIVIPLSKSAFASLGIYTFIAVYNQYFWPLLVTNTDQMRTIQIGMSYLRDTEGIDYGIVMAGAILTLIPIIFVFVFGQNMLVKGMTTGALKG